VPAVAGVVTTGDAAPISEPPPSGELTYDPAAAAKPAWAETRSASDLAA
jgi:hypothetical protein